MRLVLKWKEGKMVFATLFSLMESAEFLISKWKQQWLKQGHDVFKSLQEITLFSSKIFSLKTPKNYLATFWYNKFYRWLIVAPLGDDAFLKASRTSDLHSLGGWSIAPFFVFWEANLCLIHWAALSLLGWNSLKTY